MSLDQYAFVTRLPDRRAWQAAIDQTGIDFKLDPTLEVGRDWGFRPCEINGRSSGFELSTEPLDEVLETYPSLIPLVGGRGKVLCFRWGGDLIECACVLAATLALVDAFQAVAYYPSDDLNCDAAYLKSQLRECLAAE